MCQILYNYLIDYLFSGVFHLFQCQKTNLSLPFFWLDQQVFYYLSENKIFLVRLLLKYQCGAMICHDKRLRPWLVWFFKSSFMYLKKTNKQPALASGRLNFPCWQIMTLKPVAWVPRCVIFFSTFLSCVVYCGFPRPRGCLLIARLTQMWSKTVTVTVHK